MMLNDVLAGLEKVGKLFFDKMKEKVDGGNYPPSASDPRDFTSIPDSTFIESAVQEGTTFSIQIIVNNTGKAPFAAAYEYGSGEHGEKGKTYPIEPKNSAYMVFPKDDWPGWEDWGSEGASPNKNGLFFLTHVDHPGVEAKPYIKPTITEITDDVKKILAQEFKVSILREGKKEQEIK